MENVPAVQNLWSSGETVIPMQGDKGYIHEKGTEVWLEVLGKDS